MSRFESFVWSDEGGEYAAAFNLRDHTFLASNDDGEWHGTLSRATELDKHEDLRDSVNVLCPGLSGTYASDLGMVASDDYVYLIHGKAYLATMTE
jgi:hypothetical protein